MMSRREHGVLRVGALVVLALCAWLPRGSLAQLLPGADAADGADTGAKRTTATFASVSLAEPQAQAE